MPKLLPHFENIKYSPHLSWISKKTSLTKICMSVWLLAICKNSMLPLATGYLLVCDLLEIAVATGSKKTHEGLSRECGKCDEHVWKFHFITGKQPTGAPCELIRLSFDSREDLRACNSYILFTSFGSQNPPGFYTMRSKCSPHCIHTTIYIIVGNLNNSTIFTYLWLTRSLASMARKTLERLIFCQFRPLTLNSTRMCFYHVLKRISTSLSQVVFQAILSLIKNWKK